VTTRSKSQALIRDIAQLFVTYSGKDWQPVLDQLSNGGEAQTKVAEAVESLIAAADAASRKAKSRPKSVKRTGLTKTRKAAAVPRRTNKSRLVDALEQAFRRREFPASAKDLREIYFKIGGKADLPKDRLGAMRELLDHLSNIPEDEFEAAMQVLNDQERETSDLAEDYRRWFKLIQTTPRSPK